MISSKRERLKKGHFTIWWQILQTHCSANKDKIVSTEPEEKTGTSHHTETQKTTGSSTSQLFNIPNSERDNKHGNLEYDR